MLRTSLTRRIAVAFALMLVAASAFAERSRPSTTPATSLSLFDNNSPLPGTLTPCMFLVNLTESQKAQIQSILFAAQPTLQSLASQLQADHAALIAAANGGSADACAIGTAYLKQSSDEQALQAELKTLQPQIENILTPEQKAKLSGCLAALANFGSMHP